MILTLVALVILLIAVGGMLRSTDSSSSIVGNLAFRRDLTNRAEIAIALAKAQLNSPGPLYSTAARTANLPSSNYSATRLASPAVVGAIGVPAVLISDVAYAGAGYACLPASCLPGSDGVVLRWVIDRQCTATGAFAISTCAYIQSAKDGGGTGHEAGTKPGGPGRGLFRISVRVSGPRNTEAYIQTTAG